MNEKKKIPIIKTKMTHVAKNNYSRAQKTHFLMLTKIRYGSIIFAAVG